MVLTKINFQGFRNLIDAELEFADDFNLLVGENGSGKTNLLEAIFYVGLACSFRAKDEKNLIAFDSQFLSIEAEADEKKAFIYLDNDKKKVMLQGNEIQRLSDFIGWLDITILSIEDIWIIRGAPVRRRYFLDWVIAKLMPSYLGYLIEYRKILRQRNKILQMVNDNGDVNLLDAFDEQFIDYGNKLYQARAQTMPALKKNATMLGAELGLNDFDIDYQSTCPDMMIDQRLLKKVTDKELAFGVSLIGPHRDDLQFMLNRRPLQYYASEGEERTAAISLKLAEAEMLYNKKARHPILLLDEVGAELDSQKRAALLNLLSGQVFYASTQRPDFSEAFRQRSGRMFTIDRGKFEVS